MLVLASSVSGVCNDTADNATMQELRSALNVSNAAFIAANWSGSDPDSWGGYAAGNAVECDGLGRVTRLYNLNNNFFFLKIQKKQ